MSLWVLLAVLAGEYAFGAFCYRAGRRAAQLAALEAGRKEYEKVERIMHSHAGLDRAELLRRLHDSTHQ